MAATPKCACTPPPRGPATLPFPAIDRRIVGPEAWTIWYALFTQAAWQMGCPPARTQRDMLGIYWTAERGVYLGFLNTAVCKRLVLPRGAFQVTLFGLGPGAFPGVGLVLAFDWGTQTFGYVPAGVFGGL